MEKSDFIKWARKLQSTYEPSDETRAQLSNVDLLAIVGPTGAGKSTIIDKLGLPYVMSDVSREPRNEEKHNRNYHFRTDYLQIINEIKNGSYVQFLVSKYDEFYGTRSSSYPNEGVCTMAIIARVIPEFRKLGFRSIKTIYVMPPSYVEWMHRIGSTRKDDLLGRISEARQSILMALDDEKYEFVLNDSLDLAVDEIKTIIAGEERDKARAQLAYDTADILLEHIGDEEE